MTLTMNRRVVMAAAAATLALSANARAEGHQVLEQLHILVPGGAGGGWDGTARGTGEALTESGLVGSAVGFHSVWEYSTGPPARDERLFSITEPYPQSEGMQT